MKSTILICGLLLLVAAACTPSGLNHDPAKHRETVEQSRIDSSIVVSLDTVFRYGEAYATLKVVGDLMPDYLFSTLSGKMLIEVVPSEANAGEMDSYHDYVIIDPDQGGKAFIKFDFTTLGVVETVVENDLLTPDGLNYKNTRKFLDKHPDPTKPKAPRKSQNNVKRNINSYISIDKEKSWVNQDSKIIAKFERNQFFEGDEQRVKFTVYFAGGQVCATVAFAVRQSFRVAKPEAEILTAFDNQKHYIDFDSASAESETTAFRACLKWLVDNKYL